MHPRPPRARGLGVTAGRRRWGRLVVGVVVGALAATGLVTGGVTGGVLAGDSPTGDDPVDGAGRASAGGRPPGRVRAAPSAALAVPVSSEDLARAGLLEPAVGRRPSDVPGVVPCVRTATDRYGEYTPVCVTDEAPAMTFDPDGEHGWLVRPSQGPVTLTERHVRETLRAAVRLAVGLVDSPARWDDGTHAWERLDRRLDWLGVSGTDLRDQMAALRGSSAPTVFDIGGWKERLGLRPVPYEPGVPRVRVDDLEVLSMSVQAGDRPGANFAAAVVEVGVRTTEPVTTADGERWELRHQLVLTATSPVGDDDDRHVRWRAGYEVTRDVRGGQAVLPVLPPVAEPPAGWSRHTLDGLRYAVPPDATLTRRVDPPEPTFRTFTTGPGGARLYVNGVQHRSADDATRWRARRGVDLYGLTVPGATSAVAEVGLDDSGAYRVRVTLTATEGDRARTWLVEWDSAPARARTELEQYTAGLSVGAG